MLGLLKGRPGTLVTIRRGVVVLNVESGVTARFAGVVNGVGEVKLTGEMLMRLLFLLLLRFCLDFLAEGTFFCVERVVCVGVIVRLVNL